MFKHFSDLSKFFHCHFFFACFGETVDQIEELLMVYFERMCLHVCIIIYFLWFLGLWGIHIILNIPVGWVGIVMYGGIAQLVPTTFTLSLLPRRWWGLSIASSHDPYRTSKKCQQVTSNKNKLNPTQFQGLPDHPEYHENDLIFGETPYPPVLWEDCRNR